MIREASVDADLGPAAHANRAEGQPSFLSAVDIWLQPAAGKHSESDDERTMENLSHTSMMPLMVTTVSPPIQSSSAASCT